MRDRPVVDILTWQNTTLKRDICPWLDVNPQSQQASRQLQTHTLDFVPTGIGCEKLNMYILISVWKKINVHKVCTNTVNCTVTHSRNQLSEFVFSVVP